MHGFEPLTLAMKDRNSGLLSNEHQSSVHLNQWYRTNTTTKTALYSVTQSDKHTCGTLSPRRTFGRWRPHQQGGVRFIF